MTDQPLAAMLFTNDPATGKQAFLQVRGAKKA
jgi:hypothetical protein